MDDAVVTDVDRLDDGYGTVVAGHDDGARPDPRRVGGLVEQSPRQRLSSCVFQST